MKKLKSILVFFLLFSLPLAVFARNATSLYVYVQDINAAGPPEIYDDSIIFTYQTKEQVYFVGARFAHENYRILHYYTKNARGLFVLVLPMPEDVSVLKYRIVIDGLWIADPFNPESEEDELGIKHSLLFLQKRLPRFIISPEILPNGMVKFNLKAESESMVFIAGDFNNWDPFTYKLSEVTPGFYSITLKLYPGRHHYYFLVNGRRVIDPYNTEVNKDMDGLKVSSFMLPDF
ncbi:MAG: glycogen-binding domain-containing protein [Spirochaetales bacterium]|nr:glycogen-binding domain-containing protein [Spirochaetales bacterium]